MRIHVALLLLLTVACASTPPQAPQAISPAALPATAARPPLFAESFESGALEPKTWSDAKPGVAVDSGRVRGGRHALHVTSPPESKALMVSHDLAQPMDHLFVRMFVFAPGPLPPHNWNYLAVSGEGHSWRLGGTTEPFGEETGKRIVRVMHQPLHKQLLSEEPFATGRWVCWELEYRAKDRVLSIWLDGKPVPAMGLPGEGKKATTPWVFPKIERISVGYQHAHALPTPLDVWIDDVAVDDRRIGCGT